MSIVFNELVYKEPTKGLRLCNCLDHYEAWNPAVLTDKLVYRPSISNRKEQVSVVLYRLHLPTTLRAVHITAPSDEISE